MRWSVPGPPARSSGSTVSIDVWTTPVTPAMKVATTLEQAYVRARDNIFGTKTDSDRLAVLPPEVGKTMSSFLSAHVSPADRASFLDGAKKLDRTGGRPILTHVKWAITGEACSTDETMNCSSLRQLLVCLVRGSDCGIV